MSRKNQQLFWITVLALSLLTIACRPTHAVVSQQPISQEVISAPAAAPQPAAATEASVDRSAEAQQILASTVRLEIHGAGISHGTVLNGRYLVTHNHFPFDMTGISDTYPADFNAFSLYRSDGSPLIDTSRLTNLTVVLAEKEMLVLDFGTFGDQGFFDFLGIPSAEFRTGAGLAAGMEVAQLNWNETTAWIEWVLVRSVTNIDGVPVLVLENTLTAGASGGGIFWSGRHVGNNWSTSIVVDGNDQVIDAYSVSALNIDFARTALLDSPAAAGAPSAPSSFDGAEETAAGKEL